MPYVKPSTVKMNDIISNELFEYFLFERSQKIVQFCIASDVIDVKFKNASNCHFISKQD